MRFILDCDDPADIDYALEVGKHFATLPGLGASGYWNSGNPTRYASVRHNKSSISVKVRHTQILE